MRSAGGSPQASISIERRFTTVAAQHLIPVDGHPKKIESHAAVIRCYDKMIELLDGAVTRHVIPFENGKNVFCLFHRAPGHGPKPTILYNPGMDAMKEDFRIPFNNEFVRRGMNVCVMDGPGQGEANINQTWLALGNYARAGSKVLDFLVAHDDVDAEKIGEFGTSMGTRYGVEIAAADPRLKAVVGQMSCVGPLDVIFNQAQPNFKRIHMYMTNTYDEAAFDDLADAMDENFVKAGEAMRCPYLLVAGDMDELCPAEDVQAWMDRLSCPKELWLYEDVFHPMGEVVAEIYPAIADWLLIGPHRRCRRRTRPTAGAASRPVAACLLTDKRIAARAIPTEGRRKDERNRSERPTRTLSSR